MNLLIIGAGGHGRVVKEIAEAVDGYDRIDFVDDHNECVVGTLADLERLVKDYDSAIVAIGNNTLRKQVQINLNRYGYIIPVLVHPTAYVSPSASIHSGTVVEPRAIINANVNIGDGCIISVGAIIDHDSVIGEYSHINAGAVVMSMNQIDAFTKIDAGEIRKN